MRQLHATQLQDAGAPVKVVSLRLDHVSTAFTQDRYIKVIDRAAAPATTQSMSAEYGWVVPLALM